MEHTIVRCPHCKRIIDSYNTISKNLRAQKPNEIPFKYCQHCGNIYVDTSCKEPALEPYREYKTGSCIAVGIIGFVFISIFLFFAILVVTRFSDIISKTAISVVYYGVVGCISIGVGLVLSIRNAIKKYSNLDVENATNLQLWQESDKRLSNYEYAKALSKVGFSVPSRYLEQERM